MRLKELIDKIGAREAGGLSSIKINGVASDSRNVKEGFLFVAFKGQRQDGNNFIDEAVKRGAKVIVTQYKVPSIPVCRGRSKYQDKIILVRVKDARKALADLAGKFYNYPSRKVKCIGVTGTNGKTTVTYLLESILRQARFSCGVIGTINYHFNDKVIPAPNTTPDAAFLQSMLSEMRDSMVDYCALEVSSHSLEQERVRGIDFKYAVFTNLTSDHLDYHKNRLSYFEAKAKLFKMLNKHARAIINIDDEYGLKLAGRSDSVIVTYGIDNKADVRAYDLSLSLGGTEFRVVTQKEEFKVRTRLIGKHNVYNILSAIAVSLSEGIRKEHILDGIAKLEKVDGRLERIKGKYPFNVFVDYAHTEDALKNVLISLSKIKHRKIVLVFGCGGDRDRTKRPKMGYVASSLSDLTVITSDNPRNENPVKIMEEITSGFTKENFIVIEDRFAAIEKALSAAEEEDIVLIAGKGHEQYQVFKDKITYFDDRQAVKEILDRRYKNVYPVRDSPEVSGRL